MILQRIKRFFLNSDKGEKRQASQKEGIIKYFNWKKGFGFIRSSQTTKDVFVHIQDLNGRVRKGDRVQFQVEINDKGLRARNVELMHSM